MANMEINYFREFVVLAQTGNFVEAANTLYLSQSTLSKHIKKMELELGIELFDRTTRKVNISKFGQVLLPYAKQIAELQDKYTAILQSSLEANQHILNAYNSQNLRASQKQEIPIKIGKNSDFPNMI